LFDDHDNAQLTYSSNLPSAQTHLICKKSRHETYSARCEPRACAQWPVQVGPSNLNNPINTISESGPGISTFDSAAVFHGSDTSDGDSGPQAGAQIEQDRIIAGAYSCRIFISSNGTH
jgi:hypothetical protein